MKKPTAFPRSLLAVFMTAAGCASASPLIVTNLLNTGSGSLRQTITDAPSGSTINFAPSLAGQTIFLAGGQIAINKSLIIDGSALDPGIAISGNNFIRIFEVTATHSVTLVGLTLRNGSANFGGAILNNGGNLTVSGCTLRGNSAQHGGAIRSNTVLNGVKTTLVNSTITGNIASIRGGGIDNFQGLTEVIHCTITGNTAPTGEGGGIGSLGDTATLTSVGHSIITGNSGGDVDLPGSSPFNSFLSLGRNLIGNGDAASAFTASGDLTGAIPLLAPLGDYGGPTATMPPLPGSPAIEGGIMLSSTPATDQRLAIRPGIQLPDSGAVETVPISTLGLASLDGDSIPDLLEGPGGPYSQLNPALDDSTRDTDGDGSTDEQEIANSTNPLDPASRFRVTQFAITELNPVGHKFTLDFTSFPGLAYALEFDSDLDFSNPRVVTLGTATDFLTGSSDLRLAPAERFVRVRRNP